MRTRFGLVILVACVLISACGGGAGSKTDELQANNAALMKRVQTLEDDLHEAKRQLIIHEQAIKSMSERLRAAEANIDKLDYRSSTVR
jgi:cytochrome c556